MKRRRKLISIIVILLILVTSNLTFKWRMGNKLEAELNKRYPADSFELSKVKYNLIPIGAKAQAKAKNQGTEFLVEYIKHIGAEDEIVDNYYEARTLDFYNDKLSDFKDVYTDWFEGINVVPIDLGAKSLDTDNDIYQARLDILLAKEVQSTKDYIDAVNYLYTELQALNLSGVKSYRFYSFPGSLSETRVKSLKLDANHLTEATYPPTTTTGEAETTTTSSETTTTTTAAKVNPLFSLEVNLATNLEKVNVDIINNGIRLKKLDEENINLLEKQFNLDSEALDLLEEAQARQTRDQKAKTVLSSLEAEGVEVTTQTEAEFKPSKSSSKA